MDEETPGFRVIRCECFNYHNSYTDEDIKENVKTILTNWKKQAMKDFFHIFILLICVTITALMTWLMVNDFLAGKLENNYSLVFLILNPFLIIGIIVFYITYKNISYSLALRSYLRKPENYEIVTGEIDKFGIQQTEGSGTFNTKFTGKSIHWKYKDKKGKTPIISQKIISKIYGQKVILLSHKKSQKLIPVGIAL